MGNSIKELEANLRLLYAGFLTYYSVKYLIWYPGKWMFGQLIWYPGKWMFGQLTKWWTRRRAIQNRRPPGVIQETIGVPSSTPMIASSTTALYVRGILIDSTHNEYYLQEPTNSVPSFRFGPSPPSNNQITARSRTETYNTNHRPPTLYNPASQNSRPHISNNYNSSNNRQSTRSENHNSNQRPQTSRPQNSNDYNSSQNAAFSGTNRQFTNSRNRNFSQNRQPSSQNTPVSRNSNPQNELPARNNVNSRRGRRNNWNRRGRNAQNASTNENRTNQQKEPCVVCLDQEKRILLMPCAHLCLCRSCAQQLMSLNHTCPICRGRIERTIEAYL